MPLGRALATFWGGELKDLPPGWALEWFPGPVAAAGASVMYERGSGRRSDPPHHRGNTEEVSYLAAGGERENRAPRHHNQSMESGPGGTRVVVP